MSLIREQVKRRIFALLGKDRDAVVVSFLSGKPELARAMLAEIRDLIPDRQHYAVTSEPFSDVHGVHWVKPEEARAELKRKRIALAPTLFTSDLRYRDLQRLAFRLAPRRILAYNEQLERHHLRFGTPIASGLFVKGTRLDRIFLRPRWLYPLKKDRSRLPEAYTRHDGRPRRESRHHIVIVSPYAPFPLAHGGAVRMYNILREAAKEFDLTLVMFSDPLTEGQQQALLPFLSHIYVFERPFYREPRWSTLLPPEVNEFNAPAVAALLNELRQQGADLIQLEYTQLALYSADVLVEHDVTFDLYKQIYDRCANKKSWWDWYRWRRFESDAIKKFRSVIVMSEKDQKLLGLTNTTVIPNGVDLDRFRPAPQSESQEVLFVGSFSHFPNIVAYRFLVEEIWPLVLEQMPEAKLQIIAGANPELYWTNHTGMTAIPELQGVTLHGFVSDVRSLYEQAAIAVVPTKVSAGTNLKVLEAMAMNRAVVSTPSGCAGIPVQDGRSALIAEAVPDFAAAIVRLLREPDTRTTLAQEARTLVEAQFGWPQIATKQRELWRSLIPAAQVTVRAGKPSDLPEVMKIEESSGEAARWEPDAYLKYELQVACVGNSVVGFMVTRTTAVREREVLNIAVNPKYRNRSIASTLLRTLEGGEIFLEVRKSNVAAQTLYQRLGFIEIGRRKDYYDDPPETAIVMKWTR